MTDADAAAPGPRSHPFDNALGMPALRALAHPLRVEIMNELSDFGSATASMLAERLGESSGSTSYHLRQLAKHGIIVEDEERGTARERWWRMAAGGVTIGSPETVATPAGREATEIVSLGWHQNSERRLDGFLRRGLDLFGTDWVQASTLSTSHLQLTKEELAELGREYYVLLERLREKWKAAGAPDDNSVTNDDGGQRKRVQVQFNAFPLIEQELR
ncbi:winged helix-turn-helix domain-containing protein [Leifsonia sp. AG29]|uniref:winged helix-turn-helix domain-containing protein n=1 Tax=Leifsonia sp. AG29 TaxID=2598860 RepID=UPI00131E9D17|nr:winged helix-turn-helix domain-containing protein [Leifsonia sp. AG29]